MEGSLEPEWMCKLTTKTTVINPQMAKAMLANNQGNRAVMKRVVSKYAADMTDGRWALNGATIVVSPSGRILDGQHRLMACVEANVPFQAMIVEGVEEDAFKTIDGGTPRTAAVIASMHGITSGVASAAGATSVLILQHYDSDTAASYIRSNKHLMTHAQVVDWFSPS